MTLSQQFKRQELIEAMNNDFRVLGKDIYEEWAKVVIYETEEGKDFIHKILHKMHAFNEKLEKTKTLIEVAE